jgi:hypothetical protein
MRLQSDQNRALEKAYRELLELRERVREAELAAKSVRSRGQPPSR